MSGLLPLEGREAGGGEVGEIAGEGAYPCWPQFTYHAPAWTAGSLVEQYFEMVAILSRISNCKRVLSAQISELRKTAVDEKFKKEMVAAEKLHERARYLRGRFLNSVAVIERDIAVILTEYFCTEDEDKRKLFYEKVAEKLSIQKKKEILIDIVKNDYPRYWDKNQKILKDLQAIQEFRNKISHSVVDVSEEALLRPIEEGVGFVQWKEGKPITDGEFEDLVVRANTVSSSLWDIKQLLPFKEKPID